MKLLKQWTFLQNYIININISHYKVSTNVQHNFSFITQWNITSKSIQHLLIKILLFIFFIAMSNIIFIIEFKVDLIIHLTININISILSDMKIWIFLTWHLEEVDMNQLDHPFEIHHLLQFLHYYHFQQLEQDF